MATTFTQSVEMTQITCGQCGGTYAITEDFRAHKQEKGGGWHCPYCETSWGFCGPTQADRLKKELEAKQFELNRALNAVQAERVAREQAEKRTVKEQRKAKRAENGVCTCCNRSFPNLRRHMATKHGVKNGEDPNPGKTQRATIKKLFPLNS